MDKVDCRGRPNFGFNFGTKTGGNSVSAWFQLQWDVLQQVVVSAKSLGWFWCEVTETDLCYG